MSLATPTLSASQVAVAIRAQADPVRPPLGYRLVVWATAFLVVLLPVIYVGLVALSG